MKITMSAYDTTVSWENYDGVTIDEVLRGVVTCLRGITFRESTILAGMQDYLEETLSDVGEC